MSPVELDAVISDRIFGDRLACHPYVVINGRRVDEPTWLPVDASPDDPPPGTVAGQLPPLYSRSIRLAWRVVEKLRAEGWLVVVKEMPDGFPFRGETEREVFPARCCVELTWMPNVTPADGRRFITLRPFALADSAPTAICLCALEAIDQLARHTE